VSVKGREFDEEDLLDAVTRELDLLEHVKRMEKRLEELLNEPDSWLKAIKELDTKPSSDVVVWSTYLLSGAIEYGSFRLFTTPLGMQGQGFTVGLTRAETNLREGGRIPGMYCLDVTHVGVELFGDTEDVEAVRQSGTLAWNFVQTEVDIGPLSAFLSENEKRGFLAINRTLPANTCFCVNLNIGGRMPSLKRELRIRVSLLCTMTKVVAVEPHGFADP
jgi:hypothetical protein